MTKIPADKEDFPVGSDERIEAAIATAGTTAPVETFIKDWHDFDEDFTSQETHDSWTSSATSYEENRDAYEKNYFPEDITILERPDE